MKKFVFLMLMVLAIMFPGKLYAFHYTHEGVALSYEILSEENHTCIVKGTAEFPSSEFLLIPPTATDEAGRPYSVVGIADYAFKGDVTFKHVILPHSMIFIGAEAFISSHIQTILLSQSITSVGEAAFSFCTGLTDVDFGGAKITLIADRTFEFCTNLTYIAIPSTVTEIGTEAFSWCSSLKSVFFNYAESSLTTIGKSAFYQCGNLPSIKIPDSVTEIKTQAFDCCAALTSIELSKNLTSISGGVFSNCRSLESIEIPKSVTTIGDLAFHSCWGLTSLEIPQSVTVIGSSAFTNCRNLVSITIHDSITTIDSNAFANCVALTSIDLPDSLTEIGISLFENCSSLTSIRLPDSVTTIGRGAFSNCSSLIEVNMPESVTMLYDKAFEFCSSLTKIKLSPKLAELGVAITNSEIWANCPKIESIEYFTAIPCATDKSAFMEEIYETAVLYIPFGTKETFLATAPWKYFKNIQEKDNNAVNSISVNEGDDEIDFTLPYSVTSLNGIYMGNDITTLSNGIYIIHQGTKVYKCYRPTY